MIPPSPASLPSILSLAEAGPDVWQAGSPAGPPGFHIFGGQVAGQALRAAGLTVGPDRLPNSVHGYFLRRGQPELPLEIRVERVREGRTYTSRQVDVRQEGKTIFAMLASFHVPEPGREFDHPMPADVPPPDALPAIDPVQDWLQSIEVRAVEAEGPMVRWWGRVREPLPDDPVLHCCALLYASDLRAGGAALAAVGHTFGPPPRFRGNPGVDRSGNPGVDRSGDPDDSRGENRPVGGFGSLDHALWFHRVPDLNGWVFCEVRAVTVRDARGLVIGEMFDEQGRHLATFTQEAFLKLPLP